MSLPLEHDRANAVPLRRQRVRAAVGQYKERHQKQEPAERTFPRPAIEAQHLTQRCENGRGFSSELAGGLLGKRLCDRLRLVEIEAVHAHFELGRTFLDHEAQAGAVCAAEKHVVRVVADTTEGFGRNSAAEAAFFALVELVDGSLAGTRHSDRERRESSLPNPLTRPRSADWLAFINRHTESRAHLCGREHGAGGGVSGVGPSCRRQQHARNYWNGQDHSTHGYPPSGKNPFYEAGFTPPSYRAASSLR